MSNTATEVLRQPTSTSRVWTIANYELTRLFNTKRGWMALTAFALVWYFIFRYPIYYASALIAQPDLANTLRQAFGMVGVEELLAWSVPELAVYWMTSLILYPIFTLFITADQISSDRARGTLRFIVLRTTRFELFFGRYLGQLIILSILVFTTLIAASAMAVYREPTLASALASHFGFILFHMLFVLAPVVAVTALTSVICQSARSASFLAIIGIALSMILVAVASYYIPQLGFLNSILLGSQVSALATSSGVDSLSYLVLPLSQTIVILTISFLLFNRKAL